MKGLEYRLMFSTCLKLFEQFSYIKCLVVPSVNLRDPLLVMYETGCTKIFCVLQH